MPSFDLMNRVELFLRTGTFGADASKSSRKVTRAASKHFIYKDGLLWRSYRGRLLRVVRSDEEVREIMIRYHDNNNHAGRTRAVKEIMLMYYWVGVTEAVKNWVKACAHCQSRSPTDTPEPPVRFCLAYGCDASNYVYPELSFYRFPKEAEQRKRWLEVAQRDEGSLRMSSCLCSRHFETSCFVLSDEGHLTLSPGAIPTINPMTVQVDQVGVPSDETLLQSSSFEELLFTAAASETTEQSEPAPEHCETPAGLQEHQYSVPVPKQNSTSVQTAVEHEGRKTVIEPCFAIYNQIARYLSHRVLPMESKKSRFALKRMSKRFGLIDGVLMYTRVSPPLKVPRSREQVNSIFKQFHDNQGHYGQGICQRKITKQYYWASMTRDLAHWINSCRTCLTRTKRRWLRCSISNCTNCCGPVERGLGLTFHKFPLHNEALLAKWMKAVGRPHWHPRLWSSVCSVHFTENCFDRSGEKVTLHPEAVPTLQMHSDSATSQDPVQPSAGEEAYFAKYDAVALYLSKRKYPPGLTYVEKNTFRRFCKKFAMKDEELHMVSGDQLLLVLRSRQQVEDAMVDYHNELNHLDASKCLRLLYERFFWKTMRSDVFHWISSCPQCSSRKRKQVETAAGGSESRLQAASRPQTHEDTDSSEKEHDDDDDNGGDEEDDVRGPNEVGGNVGDEEQQAETTSQSQDSLQPRIPVLLQLRPPPILQHKAPITSTPRAPQTPFVARIWAVKMATPPHPDIQKETNGSVVQSQDWSRVQVQGEPQPGEETQLVDHPLPEHVPNLQQVASDESRRIKTQKVSQARSQRNILHLKRRKRDGEVGSPTKRSVCGEEPVEAPSTKPWPVFTITKTPPEGGNSPASHQRSRILQARTVIQQCSQAKVKTKPALDATDVRWAEIQEGIVAYVCFFCGATEDVTQAMASSLMTTKLFRKENGRSVSLLNLPGNVLLIPQETLVGQPLTNRKIHYKGGCEQWWGAQLFSNLVSACRVFMSASPKCTEAGTKVEHGVYGSKQEIVLTSPEPMTLLLEF